MGAIDTNTGIYIYDETDSQPTFSGLLNLAQNNTKTAVAALQALIASQSATSRNYVYNSNAAIAQRGTGFSVTGFTLDRWHATINNATIGRATIGESDTLFQSEYAFVHLAGAATNSAIHRQGYTTEDVAQMRGQTMTFSMAVRASAASVPVTIAVEKSATANAQSTGTWTTLSSVTVSPGLAGRIASLTVDIPKDATARGIRVSVSTTNIPSGSFITYGDILFERGTARSFYRLRSLTAEAELAAAQSFYQTGFLGWSGLANANGFATATLSFPTIMRAAPTMSILANGTGYYQDNYGVAGGTVNNVSMGFSSVTAQGAVGLTTLASSAYRACNSTTPVRWAAQAELS